MRIALTGTHGSGKTTILNHDFWKLFFPNYLKIESIRRNFSKEINSLEQSIVNYKYINTHFKNENFISGRSIFDPWAYSRLTIGLNYNFSIFHEAVKYITYDYLFYIPPEIPLIDDGFRPLEKEYQLAVDKEIKLLLDFYHIGYHVISGTIDERITKIDKIIKL